MSVEKDLCFSLSLLLILISRRHRPMCLAKEKKTKPTTNWCLPKTVSTLYNTHVQTSKLKYNIKRSEQNDLYIYAVVE